MTTNDFREGFNFLKNEDTRETKDHLDERLKKTLFSGYSKKAVKEYIAELEENESKIKSNFERQISDLSNESSKYAKECSILRDQIETLEEDKKEIIATVKEKEGDIYSLQKENEELSQYKARCLEMEERLDQYEKELNEKTSLIDEYELKLSANNFDEFDALFKDYNGTESKEEYLLNIKRENESLNEKVLTLMTEVNRYTDIEERMNQVQMRYSETVMENSKLLSEKDRLLKFMEDFQIDENMNIFARKRNATNLTKALINIENCLNELNEEVKYQQTQYEKKQNDLNNLTKLVAQIKEESDELQNKNVVVFDELQKIVNEKENQ